MIIVSRRSTLTFIAVFVYLLCMTAALGQDGEEPLVGADSAEALQTDAPQAIPNPALARIESELQNVDAALARITSAGVSADAPATLLERLRTSAAERRAEARRIADRLTELARPVRVELAALGPTPEAGAEDPELARQRQDVTARLSRIEGLARQAELFRTRADAFIADINAAASERFSQRLMTSGPSPLLPASWLIALNEGYGFFQRVVSEVTANLRDPRKARERADRLPLIALAFALAFGVGVFARRNLVRRLAAWSRPEASRRRRIAGGALIAILNLIMPLIALAAFAAALSASALLGPAGEILLEEFVIGAALMVGAHGLARAFYNPDAGHLRLSRVDDGLARRSAWLAMFLGVVVLADHVVVDVAQRMALQPAAIAVYNFAIMAPGAIALLLFARAIAPSSARAPIAVLDDDEDAATHETSLGTSLLRFGVLALTIISVLAIVLSAIGYFAATHYVFDAVLKSLGLIAAAVVVYTLLQGAVDAYLEDKDGRSSGLGLAPILVGFLICLALIPLLAIVWGAGAAELEEAWFVVVNGVQVGDARFAIGDLIKFVLAFLIVLTVVRVLQAVLRRTVLPRMAVDAGASTALVSGLGYVGVALAFLTAVSVTGLDLSSLAIVAGALSVGIGFGLQNVVSNFVSGIILLIERPFKVGDWISVGGDQGHVRKISVRSTEIETFDRTSLIVPNSDFVTTPVMNYTHGNNRGRVIVRVGVAYGSDTKLVMDLLRKVAVAHPQVHRLHSPLVLFRAFGDSSLDFELRVIIRDINQSLTVSSDLHLAIDQAFREAEIEIPFPQRVVHALPPNSETS